MEIFIARQPIFDRSERVVGYELLYRASGSADRAEGADQDRMAHDVLLGSVFGAGLPRIVHGATAFVNTTRGLLLGGALHLLDPRLVVVELLETVEPDAEAISACEALVTAGFRLALDDAVLDRRIEPLLRLASIVKVDVLAQAPETLTGIREQLAPYGVTLLAEKVESAAVRDACLALGFELFQGYHFSRPENLSTRTLLPEWGRVVNLLQMLANGESHDHEIEEAFRSDPSLSYKLLRMVNSAGVGGRGVESIGHALRMLGRSAVHRWLSLLLVLMAGSGGGVQRELARRALIRAWMCEGIAKRSGAGVSADAGFLVGLFSALDALVGMPVEQLVEEVGLAPPLAVALARRAGPLAAILALVEAYEAGDWAGVELACEEVGVRRDVVSGLYIEALEWVHERIERGTHAGGEHGAAADALNPAPGPADTGG